MACKKLKFPGKDVVLEFHIACGDELPQEADWKRFGSLRTKEFSIEWDTIDATDADSVGSLRENLATFQTMTISGDGTVKASGAGAQNLIDLTKHVINPEALGQPAAWLRMTFPDLTFTAYMLISSISRSAPYDEITTYSFEASATASDFGLIVEDTPSPDAPDPESISLVPTALSLEVGQSFDVEGVVLPVGAPQAMRWESSNPSAATVHPTSGLVTGAGAGSAVITASSAVAPLVTATAAVTVIPMVQGIQVSPTAVSVEEAATQQITASVTPVGAAPGLVYASANPAVATVNSSGLVAGVAAGATVITITSAARPAVSITVPVTVTGA